MENSSLRGWKEVFIFTFKQGVQGKGFKIMTVGFCIVLFLIGIGINLFIAESQKKDGEDVSSIGTVYVNNENGLAVLYLEGFLEQFGNKYTTLKFELSEEDRSYSENELQLNITEMEEKILVSLEIPFESIITEKEGEQFLADIMLTLEQSKLLSSGIEGDALNIVMSGVSSSYRNASEKEKSIGESITALILPMAFVFFMYFMFLLYGQTIGAVVSIEKSSKLMEMLLTFVKPGELIFGKVIAVSSIAILQIFSWIVSSVFGFFIGNIVAREFFYKEYQNIILQVLDVIILQEGRSAFSPIAVVLAFISICIAFLFYSMIAGLIASFVSKAEELAQTMSIYQMLVIAGFFAAYMIPLQEKEWLNTILRIIPITSAYLLPGDILVGNVSILLGIVYLLILVITTILVTILTGKIYKNHLFYKGTSFIGRFKRKKNGKA